MKIMLYIAIALLLNGLAMPGLKGQEMVKRIFLFGEYRITAVQNAWIDTRVNKTKVITEPIYVWLIQKGNLNILIDAGISSDWGKDGYLPKFSKRFFSEFTCRNIEEGCLDKLLPQLGVPLDSVQYVILTHAHFDHIGGLNLFPNAKVILSPREYRAIKFGLLGGYLPKTKKRIKNVQIAKLVKDPTLIGSFNYSAELFPHLKIVPSYGHTKGHVAVLLDHGADYILFTGDNAFDGKTCKEKNVRAFQASHKVQCLGNHLQVLLDSLKTN